MNRFNRRRYHSLSEMLADLKAIWAQRHRMRPLMRGETIPADFRERLMLAVTAVNDCRYCSFAHARQALAEGLSPEELAALQQGDLAHSPPDQLPALLYAQHWAESGARPTPAARERVLEQYGSERTEAIELGLRTIQTGNLLGNTWDYVLYRLSFGRWGGRRSSGVQTKRS